MREGANGPVGGCKVNWNTKINQVKDEHRRKYIGCLVRDGGGLPTKGKGHVHRPKFQTQAIVKCLADADVDMKGVTEEDVGKLMRENVTICGGVGRCAARRINLNEIRANNRRSTIKCLEAAYS